MSKHTLSSGSEDPFRDLSNSRRSNKEVFTHTNRNNTEGTPGSFFFEPGSWGWAVGAEIKDDDICAVGLDLRGAAASAIPVCLVRLHLYRVGQVKGSMHHFIHCDILPILDISRKDARL